MHWANIHALYLLGLIPILIGAYVAYYRWKVRSVQNLGSPRLIQRLTFHHSGRKQTLRFALTTLAVTLFILALARPQWGEKARTLKREGVDIAIALDISKSMLAQDVNPNRLRAAKDELQRILSQLGGDRVGLVVFAGISFAQSPLTNDYGAIRFYLRRLSPADIPVGGTASGRALSDAIELLTGEKLRRRSAKDTLRESHEQDHKRAKTQIVILITDGEDHIGDPEKAAALAAERGIRVYTVGFGSTKGEPVPELDDQGNLIGYKKDRQGNTVVSKLNDTTLRKIAEMTQGTYTHYEGQGTVANSITRSLNALEREELDSLLRIQREERFYIFLFPGLFFLLLSLMLGNRRGFHWRFWRTGTPLSSISPLLLSSAALLHLLSSNGCDSLHSTLVVSKVPEVERANDLLLKEPKKSVDLYEKAKKKVPISPELSYDLGLGHTHALGSADKENEAWQEPTRLFSQTLETPNEDLRFQALFNLGITYYRQEKWKEAMESFKGALRLRPFHTETKQAYELALAKVYPPCRELEDPFEENDAKDSPVALQQPKQEDLTLCGGDDDWFATQIYPGSIVRARATFTRLRKKEPGDPDLLPQPSMLRLALFGPAEDVLAVSQENPPPDPKNPNANTTDSETIIREIGPMRITEDMLQLPPPMSNQNAVPALARISADAPLEFKYNLEIAVIPPCFALEEASESTNDTASNAATVENSDQPFSSTKAHICKDDDDWFTFNTQEGHYLFIDVISSADAETETIPPLDVQLFAQDGTTPIGTTEVIQTPQGPLYGVALPTAPSSSTVKLRVTSKDRQHQGPYTINVYRFSPSCSEASGDDRLEDNDTPDAASPYDRSQGPLRHLRLCPGDTDFHKIDAQKDDKLVLGIRHQTFPEDADLETDPVTFQLLTADTDNTLVADSKPVQVPPPQVSPVQRGLATDKLEEDTSFILAVQGDPTKERFYSILPMDGDVAQPPPQPKQDQQDQQDQQDSQDQKDSQDQQDSGEPEDQKDQQDQKDQGDPEDQNDSKDDPKEEKDKEKDDASPKPSEEETSEEERRQMEAILESLEDNDDNIQLRKALENAPDRYIENDW